MPRLWDDSLYLGSASHYLAGRLPYPAEIATVLQRRLGLDGNGHLLDLGCGPGALTLLLAPHFRTVLGVDADADMVRVASAEAQRRGITNIEWRHAYAEDLDLPNDSLDVVTLAQSFHWMDRPIVAASVGRWLRDDGWLVHVGANTHEGDPAASNLPHPSPPRDEISELVKAYLGPHRRAGQVTVIGGETPGGEDDIYRAAGFVGPERIDVDGGEVHVRTVDQVVSSVLSLSSAAPHLFGDRLDDFVGDLRAMLVTASPEGVFSERPSSIGLYLWRQGGRHAD